MIDINGGNQVGCAIGGNIFEIHLESSAISAEKILEKYYLYAEKVEDIQPHDILGKLRPFEGNWYFSRPEVDDKFLEYIKNDESRYILIKGNPLSGKTRAVYEALKKIKDAIIIIPQYRDIEDDFFVPEQKDKKLKYIVFLDDINKLEKKNNVEIMIKRFLENDFLIIATCRTGSEFSQYKNNISLLIENELPQEAVKTLTIDRIESDYYSNSLSKIFGAEKMKEFDGNIGSLCLPIKAMEDRYRLSIKDDKNRLTIMRSLKAFYKTSNYFNNRLDAYSEELIYDFCKCKIKQYGHGADFKDELERGIDSNWSDCIDFLKSDDHGLNFIAYWKKRNRLGAILAEEIYLEKIVDPEYSIADIEADIEEFYPTDAEKRKMNFSKDVFSWGNLLNESSTVRDIRRVFEKMKMAGVKPGLRVHNIVINKLPSKEALDFFEEMKEEGVKPDEITYNTLINKLPPEAIPKVFEEMKEKGIKPDEITYSTLINKLPPDAILEVFEEMKEKGISPNKITYSTLINKLPLEAIPKVFEEMKEKGISPNEITYNTLIKKLPSDQILKVFEEMKEKGINPDEITYTTLIDKLPSDQVLKVFEEMKEKGISPNEITYTTLIKKLLSDQALDVFEEMAVNHGFADLIINNYTVKVLKKETVLFCQKKDFFEKHKEIISAQNDSIINSYADFCERCLGAEETEFLLKNIKEENWETYKIKGNLHKRTDIEKSKNFYKQALSLINDDNYTGEAIIHNNIAEFIRVKMNVKDYKEAIEHYHLGLKHQSFINGKLRHYLLYGLSMLTITISETDSLKDDLEKLRQQYNISKTIIKDIKKNLEQIDDKEKREIVKQFIKKRNISN